MKILSDEQLEKLWEPLRMYPPRAAEFVDDEGYETAHMYFVEGANAVLQELNIENIRELEPDEWFKANGSCVASIGTTLVRAKDRTP